MSSAIAAGSSIPGCSILPSGGVGVVILGLGVELAAGDRRAPGPSGILVKSPVGPPRAGDWGSLPGGPGTGSLGPSAVGVGSLMPGIICPVMYMQQFRYIMI